MLLVHNQAVPVKLAPRHWAEIESAWAEYQVKNKNSFLNLTLNDLFHHPTHLSPKEYADFFEMMSHSIPWINLHYYSFMERNAIFCSMGWLAERAIKQKSKRGYRIESEWMFQLRRVFKSMTSASCDRDAVMILESSLSGHFKLRVCGEFASPAMWLIPQNTEKIKLILPEKKAEAFNYFTWDSDDFESNKALIRVFLPSLYPLLDLSLAEEAWYNRSTVAAALANFRALGSCKAKPRHLDLPCDFYE